ncbi:hypothetical protein BGX38DRAFT_924604 [Terfezia claveryi]|nr:hypothetical protein BGX38DRAFT_924604 [Terfezia claveryi]
MPSFLSRSFSGKKKKESQTAPESVGSPIPSTSSRFRILPSRSAARLPSTSPAVDSGSSKMRGLLSRTPAASRTGSRSGENSQNAASKPLSPTGGAVDGGVVGSGGHDRPVPSEYSKPSQLPAPIRVPPPQRVNPPPNPQRGLSKANRPTSPFPPSRTPQQDYQQQLRKSTTSPIPSRGPDCGPSPYYGPYASLQNHHQWPASPYPIDNADNFNMVDLYSRQGTPALRNLSRNSTRAYLRSQSMTSELDYSPEGFGDGAPPSPRSFKGPHLEPSERRSSHNMRNNTNNIDSVMLGNRGPGRVGMGVGMVGLDGNLNSNMGHGTTQRRGGNIPPIPRIPSMYKPSAQSVRNQNQLMDSNNYSQYPPAFRNGRPRNNQGHDGRLSPQLSNFEGPSHYPMGRGQPPRMQSPRPFQPPYHPHPTGSRGPDVGPPSQDRRAPKRVSENVNRHPNPEMPAFPTSDNLSTSDNANPGRKPDSQQPQEQPTIPTALPTPSLTPTPQSRSNSKEDHESSDAESMHDEELEIANKSSTLSEVNSGQTYKPWQGNGQNHGYFRRPPPYQRVDPHHSGVSPPSPISTPATPVTASSASSTHGNSNHVIAQHIQVSAPIMPGPVKEICYTKDINLVMEQCMMGHGKTGRDSVMRRTANWQHRVGCMMCCGYGGPSGEKVESGPTVAGKHWLWLCNWCALRVCADCRCTLAEEEDHLREKGGSVGTLKVDLKALRAKILEEKSQEQERNSAEAPKEFLSGDKSEKLGGEMGTQQDIKETLRAKFDLPPAKIEAQKTQSDPPNKVDVFRDNITPTILNQRRKQSPAPFSVQHDRLSVRPVNSTMQPPLVVSTSSEEIVNSFATASSHVGSNGGQKVIGTAVEVHNKKPEYPLRVSSRNLVIETKIEPSVLPKNEPVLSPPQTKAEPKQVGVLVTPKPLPLQSSTKTAVNSSTNTTIIVSAPLISSPRPESPSRKPPPTSATAPSTVVQAVVADTPKTDITAASATIAQPHRGDSSLRAAVSPEILALITGIPVTQQPKVATAGSKSTLSVPTAPQSSARDLKAVFAPPLITPTSPPPSRHATKSPPPPQSSSSVPLSPIVQVKSLISTASSTLQAQNNTGKQRSVTRASPSSSPTTEKPYLPPLSFESELSNEIDHIFGARKYTAPKAQATHAEEAHKHETVGSPPKGGRKWFKGLFGGRK